MKAVAYLRVSEEGENIANQKFAILEFAKKHGIEIVGFFPEEDVSGTLPPRERPKYRQMLDFIKDNDINLVLFYDLSRLARNLEEGLIELKRLAEEGINFKFVAQEFLDYIQDPMLKKKVISDFLWFAELYVEDIKRRTKEALRRLKKEGKKLGRPEYPFPLEEVRRLLSQGYSVAEVHRLLVLQGKICRETRSGKRDCMKYETFRRKVKQLKMRK